MRGREGECVKKKFDSHLKSLQLYVQNEAYHFIMARAVFKRRAVVHSDLLFGKTYMHMNQIKKVKNFKYESLQ